MKRFPDMARLGSVRHGLIWRGNPHCCSSGRQKSWLSPVKRGPARLGEARRGSANHTEAQAASAGFLKTQNQ